MAVKPNNERREKIFEEKCEERTKNETSEKLCFFRQELVLIKNLVFISQFYNFAVICKRHAY